MKISKRFGFTLAEALITLSLIGALAVIVLPGLIKDTMNRSMSALVQSTVTSINDAVQSEMVRKRANNIKDTDIQTNPAAFLKNLDFVKTVEGNDLFASSYRTFSGTSLTLPAMEASVKLKNGVVVGLGVVSEMPVMNIISNEGSITGAAAPILVAALTIPGDIEPPNPIGHEDKGEKLVTVCTIYIDVNGDKAPNIAGVDYFELVLVGSDSRTAGTHLGDIGCPAGTSADDDIDTCKSSGTNCYCALEQSGFDHNYLK